jgi:N-acyl amino acid synthase of PEP-CTERM/exosortase system
MTPTFRGTKLDDDPRLLEQSYRLRYQVYCLERKFLSAVDYPSELEVDVFDRDSVHVGVLDVNGDVVGTARIVTAGRAGLPLLRHCTLFAHEHVLDEVGNKVVEVSRVCISRHYARRRDDTILGGPVPSAPLARVPILSAAARRQRRAEPFVTLLKAIIYGAKREGATHLIYATDAALHRWLVHYGFPYRLVGPEVDYYGPVAPYIMSLDDLDQVILSGQFEVLDHFPVGRDPGLWPEPDEADVIPTNMLSGCL